MSGAMFGGTVWEGGCPYPHGRLQVSMCSISDLGHPGYHTDRHVYMQTDRQGFACR